MRGSQGNVTPQTSWTLRDIAKSLGMTRQAVLLYLRHHPEICGSSQCGRVGPHVRHPRLFTAEEVEHVRQWIRRYYRSSVSPAVVERGLKNRETKV